MRIQSIETTDFEDELAKIDAEDQCNERLAELDDDLRAARGIVLGMAFSLPIWAVVGAFAWWLL